MNVIRTEPTFQPPRERPEMRPRQAFEIALAKRYLENNVQSKNKRICTSTSSCSSRNPRLQTAHGRRAAPTPLATSTSRNCASRSGTRTTTGAGSTSRDSSGMILAVTTGRGDARCEVGLAAVNIHCPHVILCQISDSPTYINVLSRLYLFDPTEVLMPDTMCDGTKQKNVLYQLITENFPDMQVIAVSRIHFNDTVGLERVKTLCLDEYSAVELFVKQKYYALAAAAALFKYVEYVQRIVYAPKSMKIEFQGSPNATIIDLESARSLELVQSQCGRKNVSFLSMLDQCSTPMGRKLLRTNILQPPCEQDIILERQVAVAELVSNRSLRALVQPVVRQLYGADRLLALSMTPASSHENSVQCAEQNLNYVLLLKHLLDTVPELRRILSVAESDFIRKIEKKLENDHFRLMREKILETIHPDAKSVAGYTSSNMQRCFAIKAGINDLLDIARQTYCELIDDMKSMVESLANKYNLPLSLNCNASLGFHIKMLLPRNVNENNFTLPTEFVEVRKSVRTYTMTTDAFAAMSQQCKIACDELHLMSNILLCDVLKDMRPYIGCMFHLSADVAELDLVTSLALVSSHQTYVRPTFGRNLEVVESRHPMMDAFGLDSPVSNDIRASVPRNATVISGANMSGKSTYLKQIVLLHVMAQIGCFVPAEKAVFRITDAIFCKIGVRDDIECNASTFALEMKESQYILQSITANSLVVLDEPCKGTATEEGGSIAWAICEKLLNTTSFIFVATHFFYLTKLADLHVNVINRHFETKISLVQRTDNRRSTYTHKLKHGVAPTDDYGIVLAESSGLPKPVTRKAMRYASARTARRSRDSLSVLGHTNTIPTGDSEQVVGRTTPDLNALERDCYDVLVDLFKLLESDNIRREQVNSCIEFLIPWRRTDDEGNDERVEIRQRKEGNVTNEREADVQSVDGGRGRPGPSARTPAYFGMDANANEIVRRRTTYSDDHVPSNYSFNMIQPVCIYSGSENGGNGNVSQKSPVFPITTTDRKNDDLNETLKDSVEFTPRSDSRIPSPSFLHKSLSLRTASSSRLGEYPLNLFSPSSDISNINIPSLSFSHKSFHTMQEYEYSPSDLDIDLAEISDLSTFTR